MVCFSRNIDAWRRIGTDKTVLDWIQNGVRVPLKSIPEPFEYKNHDLNEKECAFVDKELNDLLLAGSVERLDYKPGLHST